MIKDKGLKLGGTTMLSSLRMKAFVETIFFMLFLVDRKF